MKIVTLAFKNLDIVIEWKGQGKDEIGINSKNGKIVVKVDSNYFRPTEVDLLLGDSSKAKKELGWEPKVKFEELVKVMIDADFEFIKKIGY